MLVKFIFTARCYAECGYATVCRLSVRPFVCLSFCDVHVPWSHRLELFENNFTGLPQHGPYGATRTPPKLEWNRGGVTQEQKKPAISPRRCKVEPRLLWRTNRKSHTRFRLVPKSWMTLNGRNVLSVCNVQVPWSHIGWNTSKIISRPNSLRFMLQLTPTWVIWCNGNTPKIRVEQRWGHERKSLQYLWNGAYTYTVIRSPSLAFQWSQNADLEWPLNVIQGVLCWALAPDAPASTRLPC